jgi:glyoxylase-like metal-dependent hydrolase (beta-lactamase superfamily II)
MPEPSAGSGPRPAEEPTYEVFAIRLGSVERPARDNFLVPGEREGTMRLDFTMWLVVGAGRIIAVDTGFSRYSGTKRDRILRAAPAEALLRLDIAAADVEDVVLSHLHYDHAGNLDDFPRARVWVQAEEIAYATGRPMSHPRLSHFYEAEDVAALVRQVYAGRVGVIDGRHELASGVELHLVGGHTRGLQVVRVRTERGWVVLAADAVHYYANLAERNPFPAVLDVGQMLDSFEQIVALADSVDHIVPGHDPLVFERYPSRADDEDIVALHLPPTATAAS